MLLAVNYSKFWLFYIAKGDNMSLTLINRNQGITTKKVPLVLSRQKFIQKINKIIGLRIKNPQFMLTKKEKKHIADTMKKMIEHSWQPKVERDNILSDREYDLLISTQRRKGELIYIHKKEESTTKFRIKFIHETYDNYPTKKAKFAVNIRLHYPDIVEEFTNIANQTGTTADFSMSPQEANFNFLVDYKSIIDYPNTSG